MTATRRRTLPSLPAGFDPRSLPIAVKFAIGLGLVVIVSAIVISQLMQRLVYNSQIETALTDAETFSRTQAFRVVDRLGQEMISMGRLGASSVVQTQLLSYLERDPIHPTEQEIALQPNPVLTLQVTSFRETHSEFDSVALFDTQGYILAIDPVPADVEVLRTPGQWPWYGQALNEGRGATMLLNPFDDQLTGQTGIHIILPVYNERDQTQLLGILYGVWNMSNALDIVDLGGTREGLVLQADGTVLISPTDPRGAKLPATLAFQFGQEPSAHAEEGIDHEHVTGAGGSLIHTAAGGRQWIYGYTRLSDLGLGDVNVNSLSWVVVARQPLASIESRAATLLGRLSLALGVSTLVLTLLVLGLARSIIGPLRRLTDAAISIEEGAMDAEIPRLPEDEMGQLANVLRNLVGQLVYRVRQLRAAVQVSRAAALTLDVKSMLEGVVKTLEEQFGYPEVRIFLTETGGHYVRLTAAAGGESERMLRAGFRLPVDETSLVGRCVLLKEAQVGGVGGHLLGAGLVTERSEIAIPLQSASGVIGALYIFAGRGNVFAQEDIDILSLVLDQVAGSIENARLFEQSATNLAEIEALNRQLTRQAWEEYVGDSGGLRHTLDPEEQWPQIDDRLRQRSAIRAEIYTNADGRSVLAAPLVLRGETIGTLAVTRPPDEGWSQEEVTLIESVANRMVMIAEGLRLVEESAELAQRERTVNDISANLLQRAANVETVLQAALGQFSEALGSDHVSLRIGVPPVEGDRQITSGSAPTQAASESSSSGNGANEPDTVSGSGNDGQPAPRDEGGQ